MPNTTGKRGGRRPGAGAPKGNLNALKHGRHSAQRRARRDARLRRDAAAVGLWLGRLTSDLPSPTPLPRLSRRQTRLLARALAELALPPPGQSTRTGPQGPLPDSPAEKTPQDNQTVRPEDSLFAIITPAASAEEC